MRANEFLTEAQVPSVREQIIADVRKHGGDANEYFVRFTNADKLGYSARQLFGRTPDVDDSEFDVDYIGTSRGRLALWFYPLKTALDTKSGVYAGEQPYAWLVQLKPNAWLQTVKNNNARVENPPAGKQRVGILRMSTPPAAIFFKPGFDVVGRYYDYAGQHKRHGEVKGRPEPTLFQRIRGER